MPIEKTRKTSMRRVTDPNDPHQYVDVKVIDEITFVDNSEMGQEYRFRFANLENGQRIVHIVTVTGSDSPAHIDVQRIDQWNTTIQQEMAQEYAYRLPGNASEPPVHLKTHDFKVENPSDSNLWVKMQRIDEISFLDPHESGQEKHFILDNLDDDMTNPTEVITSSDGTSINPPWRFDPWQNPVDVNWGRSGGPLPPPPPKPPPPPTTVTYLAYMQGISGGFGPGALFPGSPSLQDMQNAVNAWVAGGLGYVGQVVPHVGPGQFLQCTLSGPFAGVPPPGTAGWTDATLQPAAPPTTQYGFATALLAAGSINGSGGAPTPGDAIASCTFTVTAA